MKVHILFSISWRCSGVVVLKMVGGVGGFYVSTHLLLDAASLTDFLDPEKYSHATARRFHKPDIIVVNIKELVLFCCSSRAYIVLETPRQLWDRSNC